MSVWLNVKSTDKRSETQGGTQASTGHLQVQILPRSTFNKTMKIKIPKGWRKLKSMAIVRKDDKFFGLFTGCTYNIHENVGKKNRFYNDESLIIIRRIAKNKAATR